MSDLRRRLKDFAEHIERAPGRWQGPAIATMVRSLLGGEGVRTADGWIAWISGQEATQPITPVGGENAAQARREGAAEVTARVEALADEIAADQSMTLAPGSMVRDAVVAKVRAALRGDA